MLTASSSNFDRKRLATVPELDAYDASIRVPSGTQPAIVASALTMRIYACRRLDALLAAYDSETTQL